MRPTQSPAVILVDRLPTPVGDVVLAVHDGCLCAVGFVEPDGSEDWLRLHLARRFGPDCTIADADDPSGVTSRFRAYFAGDLDALDAVVVDTGGTPFQQEVWQALRAIPVGETRTYGQLAATLGRPGAARAVGITNSRNPVAIVLPCHRVVGADGTLTGYAGGLDRKRWLLQHEGATLAV
jgi:methylated-DNA-[protein]-cysteine S-methyltransferase